MKTFMLSYPRRVLDSSKDSARKEWHSFALKALMAVLLSVGLAVASQGLAAVASTQVGLQIQPASTKAVQSEVGKQTADATAWKRKQQLSDAASAIAETRALKAQIADAF